MKAVVLGDERKRQDLGALSEKEHAKLRHRGGWGTNEESGVGHDPSASEWIGSICVSLGAEACFHPGTTLEFAPRLPHKGR